MKTTFYFIALFLLFSACGDDDKANSEFYIESIEVIGSNVDDLSIATVIIENERGIASILPTLPLQDDLDSLVLDVDIEISKNASIYPEETRLVFYSADDEYYFTITAQNGELKEWVVRFVGNQLANSHFETWHTVMGADGKMYKEPGNDSISIWETTNYMTTDVGMYGTTKFPEADESLVKMTTDSTSIFPLVAANIFNGVFYTEGLTNDTIAIVLDTVFGVPFGLRPTSMKIWYRYLPGEQLMKATPNSVKDLSLGFTIEELEGIDACGIYINLERISGDEITSIAELEFTSSDRISRLIQIEVPFAYISDDYPTHITFMATSSKDGSEFKGAIGSTLYIDDLELVYD